MSVHRMFSSFGLGKNISDGQRALSNLIQTLAPSVEAVVFS